MKGLHDCSPERIRFERKSTASFAAAFFGMLISTFYAGGDSVRFRGGGRERDGEKRSRLFKSVGIRGVVYL
jgi:hypothetical protein